MLTCGSGLVHDLRLIMLPPPQDTLTMAPFISLTHGVATVDQGDHPPLIVIILFMALQSVPSPKRKVTKYISKILSMLQR